jgi:hypothetical protein
MEEEGRKSYADIDGGGGKGDARAGYGVEADLGRWVKEWRRRKNVFGSMWEDLGEDFFAGPHSRRLVLRDKI